MKKVLLTVGLVFPLLVQCGVADNTLVYTAAGLQAINKLQQGDMIACADEKLAQQLRSVKSMHEVAVDQYVELTTDDNTTMCLSVDQYVFVPFKWISVRDLSLNDFLLRRDGTYVHITNICRKQQQLTMVFIEVDEHANFFASQNGILIHNGVAGATVGFYVAGTATAAAFGYFYYVVGVGVTAVAGPGAGCAAAAGVAWICAPVAVVATHTAAITGAIAVGTATGPI